MPSNQHVSFLFLWFFFSLLPLSSQFPCPQPSSAGLSAFSPSQTFTPQPQFQTEWYYVAGTLCVVNANGQELESQKGREECEMPLGFQITTLLFNITAGGRSFITSSSIIAVTYFDKHYFSSTLGVSPIYPHAEQPFDLTFASAVPSSASIEYQLVQGIAGEQGSAYNFVAITSNVTINVLLRSESPLMLQGDNGFTGIHNLPPPQCEAFFYVTMPQLATSGVIRLNDDILLVSGMSWFDHEWGTNNAGLGWIWLGLRIGSTSVMISVARDSSANNLYSDSILNLQWSNGTMLHGRVTSMDILSNWTSPHTQITYPIHLRIHTSLDEVEELLVIPRFLDQEVANTLPGGVVRHLWEGYVKVTVGNGTGHQGDGYLELVGFTATS